MTISEMRRWAFEKSLEDEWWVSLNGEVEKAVMSAGELEDILRDFSYDEVKVLHASQAGLGSPPWVDLVFGVERVYSRGLSSESKKGVLSSSVRKSDIVVSVVMVFLLCLGLYLFHGRESERMTEEERVEMEESGEKRKIRVGIRVWCRENLNDPAFKLDYGLYEKIDEGYLAQATLLAKNGFNAPVKERFLFKLNGKFDVVQVTEE